MCLVCIGETQCRLECFRVHNQKWEIVRYFDEPTVQTNTYQTHECHNIMLFSYVCNEKPLECICQYVQVKGK